VREIYKMGLKHGMKLAAISGVNGPFTDEDIARVRELALAARGEAGGGAQAGRSEGSGRKADACAQARRQGLGSAEAAGLRRGVEDVHEVHRAPAQAEPGWSRDGRRLISVRAGQPCRRSWRRRE